METPRSFPPLAVSFFITLTRFLRYLLVGEWESLWQASAQSGDLEVSSGIEFSDQNVSN